MNIGIDARLLERRITGIGRALTMLLTEVEKFDKINKYFLFTYENLEFNKWSFFKNIPTIKSIGPQKLFAPLWINLILPHYIKKNDIHLFFSVNQMIPLRKIKNVKYVFMLHDVIYKVNRSFHPFIYRKYLQFFTYFSIKKSDLIITVSEYSKQDILKYYKVEESKIKVIYLAADKTFCKLDISQNEKIEFKKSLGLPKNIVFYLGMIENRKNIKCILNIAAELSNKKEIKFLLVGKIGYGGKKLLKEIVKRENIIYLNHVDDLLLKKIFAVSSLFLFPSYYEGFGFPPLEAMQSGLPVVASKNSSLLEIIGSGGLLHEADDYKSFSKDIINLLQNEDKYSEMREMGYIQSKKFNIENTVRQFVYAFNSFQ